LDPSILNGKKIIGAQGNILGEAEGIDVDLNTWQASTLYVNLSDEAAAGFGLNKPFMSRIIICLPTQTVGSIGDVITLKETLSNLEGVARECRVNPPKLRGKTVMGANGYIVGEVEGLDVEPGSWRVMGLQVSLCKEAAAELGLSKSFLSKVIVVIPSGIVGSVGNMIILSETVRDIGALARCLKC
jgi:sporulation protein YlmC with PRC-barrel domain